MIAYVLLIVIAITVSIFVYEWLKNYAPKEKVECEDGVSLVIEDYSCLEDINKTNITISNKGLFNVDGFFIKISNDDGKPDHALTDSSAGIFDGQVYFADKFKPGDIYSHEFSYSIYNNITEIGIEPYILKQVSGKEEIVLCNNAVSNIETENCG